MVSNAFQGAHEISARRTPAKASNEMCVLIGIQHAPHLGFRFTFQFGSDGGGRMNLQREPFASVEKFHE